MTGCLRRRRLPPILGGLGAMVVLAGVSAILLMPGSAEPRDPGEARVAQQAEPEQEPSEPRRTSRRSP